MNRRKIFGAVALFANAIVILIELLVLSKVLKYNVIFGGTFHSYEEVFGLAIGNIICLLVLCTAIMIQTNIIVVPKLQKVSKGILIFFLIYFCINFVLNLLAATWFEKIVGDILASIEILCFIQIIKKQK